MKKLLRLVVVAVIATVLLSGCSTVCLFSENGERIVVPRNKWPFLSIMVDGYFYEYYEYPDVDELIKYWNLYNPEMERINSMKINTLKKIKRKRNKLFAIQTDTSYYLLYKNKNIIDTLDYRLGDFIVVPHLDTMMRRRFMRRVLMHDMQGFYLEEAPELFKEFIRGRTEILKVIDHEPYTYDDNFSVLKYDREKGLYNMFPKDGFVLDKFEYKERIEDFVKDFTEKHNLQSVIFAFPHN